MRFREKGRLVMCGLLRQIECEGVLKKVVAEISD